MTWLKAQQIKHKLYLDDSFTSMNHETIYKLVHEYDILTLFTVNCVVKTGSEGITYNIFSNLKLIHLIGLFRDIFLTEPIRKLETELRLEKIFIASRPGVTSRKKDISSVYVRSYYLIG